MLEGLFIKVSVPETQSLTYSVQQFWSLNIFGNYKSTNNSSYSFIFVFTVSKLHVEDPTQFIKFVKPLSFQDLLFNKDSLIFGFDFLAFNPLFP